MKHKFILILLWLLLCLVGSPRGFTGKRAAAQAAPASPLVLPDAVYFLNERGQIARLEVDGQQMSVVTQEDEPVTAFDVAPDGSRLAYVSGNTLIEIEYDMVAATRRVKVQGAAYDPAEPRQVMTERLGAVLYTPDGQHITFGRNGVNWIAAGADNTPAQVLLPNELPPDPKQTAPGSFYHPRAWSPDGTRLLLYYAAGFDSVGYTILNVTTGVREQGGCGGVPSAVTWSLDSQSIYCSEFIYGSELGQRLEIKQVAVTTGATTILVQGLPPAPPTATNPYRIFAALQPVSDGSFLAFGNQWITAPPTAGLDTLYGVQRYALQRISADGRQITPLRTDRYRLQGDLLWAPDGSGALISDATTEEAGRKPAPLLWLPADGSPAVELFAVGRAMQWRTRPITAKPVILPNQATGATTTATVLQTLNVRNGPGIHYAVLSQLATGASVQVTGRTAIGSELWWQIVYPIESDGRAWINGDPELVQVTQGTQVPVVTP